MFLDGQSRETNQYQSGPVQKNHHPGTPKLNHNNQERQINTSQVQYKTITIQEHQN
jgi:hypothetical protein